MQPAHDIPSLELLLAQEGWVRALARKLVGREGDAEDVAQSALVVALENPPRSGENAPVLRAWLAQVARRLAIGGQRANSRRIDRERRVAREEALPSASEIHAREEERRVVVEALLLLSEPFRTTLLLRYYRGLEPIEIARAMEVPDSTVRNRLARGLEQLKQKLEARQGSDWRAGCVLLAGPLVPASKGVLIGKGVVMGVNLKVAISCSVVALAGLAWWNLHERADVGTRAAPLDGSGAVAVVTEAGAKEELGATAPDTAARLEQKPASSSAIGTSASPDPVGILVYGSVRQDDGSPTTGAAWVRLLSPEAREFSKPADLQGAFAFTGLTAGKWTITACLTGYAEQRMELDLGADQPVRRVDLKLARRTQIPVRIVTPDGRRLRDALRDSRLAGALFDVDIGIVASERECSGTIPGRALSRFQPSRLGQYCPTEGSDFFGFPPKSMDADGVLVVDDRFPMFVCATWRNAVLESRRCESAPESLTFTIEPAQVLEHTGGFRIRLLDAVDHTPVWPLRVGLSLRGVHVGLGRSPGAEGVLECPQLPPGAISISLEFSDHERIAELLDVQSGVITDLGTRELSRANPCEIEVVDSSGGPLANVRFTLYDAAALAAQRPLEAGYQIASNSAGILPCQVGPSETWILPCDDHWTSEPARLPTGGRQRIIMQAGCELVTTIAATVRDDALLLVRGRDRRCVVIEQARPGFLVRSRLPPGHYEVELVTFDGTIASRSIELGDKPLVIDLAP